MSMVCASALASKLEGARKGGKVEEEEREVKDECGEGGGVSKPSEHHPRPARGGPHPHAYAHPYCDAASSGIDPLWWTIT